MYPYRYGFDWALAAVIAIPTIFFSLFIFWAVTENNRINTINRDFTVKCEKLGGQALITNKNLCIGEDGRILDWER